MRKIVLILSLVGALFQGCGFSSDNEIRKVTQGGAYPYIKVWCDKKSNIEYLIYDDGNSGGITVRLNSKGFPKSCEVNYEQN